MKAMFKDLSIGASFRLLEFTVADEGTTYRCYTKSTVYRKVSARKYTWADPSGRVHTTQVDSWRMVVETYGTMRRTLDRHEGSEGPSHDPYGWTERILTVNTTVYRLRSGALGYDRFSVNDEAVDGGVAAWESATGLTVRAFDKAYDRVHPYFEDPMGGIGRYI